MRQNAAHSRMTAAASMPAAEDRQRIHANKRRCGQRRRIEASRPVEHPGRHFQPLAAAEPLNVQRKTTPSALSTASWIATCIPNHGCQ